MIKQISIKDRTIGKGHQLYIIAEMACSHDGNAEKAKRLVDSAVQGGADAVQLQFFNRDALMTPQHDIYDLLGTIELNKQAWREVYDYARQFPLDVFACTFDLPSFELAVELGVDGIKLNSSDLSNHELLERVAKSGLPYTIGTGASTVEEISKAVELTMESGNHNMVIMHGIQNFPTPSESAHINKLLLLDKLFPFPVGYADHTDAEDSFSRVIDLLAIGAGACLVEKHITLDRAEKGTDYQAALEPQEFADYVALMHKAHVSMGALHWQPLGEQDIKYRKFQKKNIVAERDMPKGTTVTLESVTFKRTGIITNLHPGNIDDIVGRKICTDITKDTPLDWNNFDVR